MSWDKKALLARINESDRRTRFSAGSPNQEEVEAYRRGLLSCSSRELALVLGMTPELRVLVADIFNNTVAVDNNPDSVDIYRDWLPEKYREKESLVLDNWFHLRDRFEAPFSAIVGDGIFGNILGRELHYSLLSVIHGLLSEGGVFVTRKVVIPRHFDPEKEGFDAKIMAFRNGDIGSDEFGFFTRMLGFYSDCYSRESCILDNRKVFGRVEQLLHEGEITSQESDSINRYYFSGENCVVPEDVWENMLRETGFEFEVIPCFGKDWYRYYKVYHCWHKQ